MIRGMKGWSFLHASFVIAATCWVSERGSSQAQVTAQPAQDALVAVPYVGCASDGQMGPVKAPAGLGQKVVVPTKFAGRLSYYKAEYSAGVLAPRGWHCFSTYGSNGASLFVSSGPLDTKALFSPEWKGFAGPMVQISVSSGGTSGRFEVAKVIARVFPAYKEFVENVIAEGIEPAGNFPFGPYPQDKLTYRGKNVVEFETPPKTKGLGTNSRLASNASPIAGVAIIAGVDTDLIQLSARLPDKDRDLRPIIVKQIESEAVETDRQ
jgi:hypothetical protein